MNEVKAEDAGPFGTLMPPFQGDPFATVVKEVRDRGLAWKDYAHGVRRGRELVICGALRPGNYMYIMSYAFHDDGTIAFRVGATGQNFTASFQAHTHRAHWRIDIDLVDGKKNSAMLMKHVEDIRRAMAHEDLKEPFNGGIEGGVDWDPKEFTMIRVESEKENARGETDCLRPHAAALRHPTAQRTVHAPRPVGEQSHPDRPLEFMFANLPNIIKDRGSGRRDRHRALDQLGGSSRAAA